MYNDANFMNFLFFMCNNLRTSTLFSPMISCIYGCLHVAPSIDILDMDKIT